MDVTKLQPCPPIALPEADSTHKYIRGSSLLFVGRLIAILLNFSVQVLMVRYLSKQEFGAFALALSVVSIGTSLALFGLDKAITRFVPIYEEQDDKPKIFSTIWMTLTTILGIGMSIVLLVYGFQNILIPYVIDDPLSVTLLVMIIILAPLGALDSWFQGMFAVFASPRAIFFRRHLLGPGLKLTAVLLVMGTHSSVQTLAIGYLIGGLIGVGSYAMMFWQMLRDKGLLQYSWTKPIQFPIREIFSFSIPLLSTDLLLILKSTMVVVFIGYFGTTADVAEFKAVLPIAGLNLVVLQGFKFLYTPSASRLYARNDQEGINNLFWQTAMWIGLLTFPIFAVTFSLAEPLTLLLFGERYVQSGLILAVLSVGTYLNAAVGFNSYTLRVYGKVRYIVGIDILSAVVSLCLSLWLIPTYGALGGAMATTGTLVVYNLFNHLGLLFGTGVDLYQWQYLKVYMSIIFGVVGILFVQMIATPPIFMSLVLVAVVSLLLIKVNRVILNCDERFPELQRVPLLRGLLLSR